MDLSLFLHPIHLPLPALSSCLIVLFSFLTSVADACAGADRIVHIGALSISTGSLIPYANSTSVIIQVGLFIVLGALADFGRARKMLLMTTIIIACLLTMGMFFVSSEHCTWLMGVVFMILANGLCIVLCESPFFHSLSFSLCESDCLPVRLFLTFPFMFSFLSLVFDIPTVLFNTSAVFYKLRDSWIRHF